MSTWKVIHLYALFLVGFTESITVRLDEKYYEDLLEWDIIEVL
jgi:hypothetical protein